MVFTQSREPFPDNVSHDRLASSKNCANHYCQKVSFDSSDCTRYVISGPISMKFGIE